MCVVYAFQNKKKQKRCTAKKEGDVRVGAGLQGYIVLVLSY
jgi:hypothetical protein